MTASMTIHEYGAGNESAIVLVHPSMVMWDYFEYVVPLLAERHRLIVPALPGYDESRLDQDFTSVEDVADEYSKEDLAYVAKVFAHTSYQTIWRTFESCNNYARPKGAFAYGGALQYWYGEKEAKDRRWDIDYVKARFPAAELIELEGMGHASMASLHPQEMAARLEALVEG